MTNPVLKINLEGATHFTEVSDDVAAPIIKKGNVAVLSEVPIKDFLTLTSGIYMAISSGSKFFFRGVRTDRMLWMYKLDNTPLRPQYPMDSIYRVEAVFHSEQEMPKNLRCVRI